MYNTYGTPYVPSGWLIPFNYIKVGREISSRSKIRLIVPHSEGQSDASASVYPCYYEITYQLAHDIIKSISGIRGTIGGHVGEGLNPLDIVKFTSAYATLIRKTTAVKSNKIVVGRDARISGEMVKNVVCGTLMGMGFDVVNIGLASTPTTELAVTMEGACGGIILTASHNPRQWNALKLLNEHGEFLNKEEGNEVLRIAEAEALSLPI